MPTSSLIAMAGAVPAIDPLVRLVQRCLQALGHAAIYAGAAMANFPFQEILRCPH